MSSQTYILRIANIRVKIEDKTILSVDSIQIPKGKITCVVGKSGAGKSTLLKSLVKLQSSENDIYYKENGTEISTNELDIGELRKKITYLPQTPSMFPGTTFDNLLIAKRMKGLGADLTPEQARELLDRVNLKEIDLNQRASDLSGGEKQRIALARTLIGNPKLLLLDEPTSSLDPITKKFFDEQINTLLQADSDLSLMMITHSLFQMMNVADYVLILHEGKVIKLASMEELFGPKDKRKELLKKYDEAEFLDKLTRGDFEWQ